MNEYAKNIRKQIRKVRDEAYNRELGQHLSRLAGYFEQWEQNEITSGDLNHFIHKYHQGVAREVWVRYYGSRSDEDFSVAFAVARGILREDEIPEDVLKAIAPRIAHARQFMED